MDTSDTHKASDRQQGWDQLRQLWAFLGSLLTLVVCQKVLSERHRVRTHVAVQVDLKDQRQVSACEAQQLADAEGGFRCSKCCPIQGSLQT